MGFVRNTNQIANIRTANAMARQLNGPAMWTVEVLTDEAGRLVVRIRKGHRWTQAPVLTTHPPSWGHFEPFPPPGRLLRNWDREISRAIRRAVR